MATNDDKQHAQLRGLWESHGAVFAQVWRMSPAGVRLNLLQVARDLVNTRLQHRPDAPPEPSAAAAAAGEGLHPRFKMLCPELVGDRLDRFVQA